MFTVATVLVIIAASIALPTMFSPSTAAGFAQVREQLDRILTITFDGRLEAPGTTTETLHLMSRSDGRSREQYADGRYVVSERTESCWTRMEVNPATNTVRISYGFPQALPFDLLSSVRDLPESTGAIAIKPRTINGRTYPGLLIAVEVLKTSQQIRLWIDPETHLPVHGEVTTVVEQGHSDGDTGKHRGDTQRAVATISNFKYNIELKDSLFALVPPDGYTVVTEGSPPKGRTDRWPPEKLLLTVGEGIGPVKFGMSKEQVAKMFGEPEVRREPTRHSFQNGQVIETEQWYYNSQGFSVSFRTPGGLSFVDCRPAGFMQRAFQGRTREGIGLGSSAEDVRRAYPDMSEEPINKDGFGSFAYPDCRLMVGVNDGVVSMLSISGIRNEEPAANGQRVKGGPICRSMSLRRR